MQITISDIRDAGYCVSGARRWFEAHELPFNDFLKNGIAADKLLATNDEMARRVVQLKKDAAHG